MTTIAGKFLTHCKFAVDFFKGRRLCALLGLELVHAGAGLVQLGLCRKHLRNLCEFPVCLSDLAPNPVALGLLIMLNSGHIFPGFLQKFRGLFPAFFVTWQILNGRSLRRDVSVKLRFDLFVFLTYPRGLFFQFRVLCLLRGLIFLNQIAVLYQSHFPVGLVLLELGLGLCGLDCREFLPAGRANITSKGFGLDAAPHRPVLVQLCVCGFDALFTVLSHPVQIIQRPGEFVNLGAERGPVILHRHILTCPVRGVFSVQCF